MISGENDVDRLSTFLNRFPSSLNIITYMCFKMESIFKLKKIPFCTLNYLNTPEMSFRINTDSDLLAPIWAF